MRFALRARREPSSTHSWSKLASAPKIRDTSTPVPHRIQEGLLMGSNVNDHRSWIKCSMDLKCKMFNDVTFRKKQQEVLGIEDEAKGS